MAKTCNDSTACFSEFLGSGGCRGGDKKYSGRLGVLVAAPATKLGGGQKNFGPHPFYCQKTQILPKENTHLPKGQITPRKSRTPFVKMLLFYLKIIGNPFVLGKILYAIYKSELPLAFTTSCLRKSSIEIIEQQHKYALLE